MRRIRAHNRLGGLRLGVVLVVLAALSIACSSTAGTPSLASTPSAGSSIPSSLLPRPSVAAPSPTLIPGCLPGCVTGELTQPGPLSGDYATQYFFGGQMTVTVPAGWEGFEDSSGELSVGPAGSEDARVEFWIDVYAVSDAAGTRDTSVGTSAQAMKTWVASNPNLDLISRKPAKLGSLAAEAFDWSRSAKARNSDPDCPSELAPCVAEFGYPEWDAAYTEGGPFRDRLIIAATSWGGTPHAVYAMIWATNADSFAAIEADAMRLVEGARLPAGIGS